MKKNAAKTLRNRNDDKDKTDVKGLCSVLSTQCVDTKDDLSTDTVLVTPVGSGSRRTYRGKFVDQITFNNIPLDVLAMINSPETPQVVIDAMVPKYST